MGATHVTVTIRNPAEPDRCWEGLFLVDKGATDSLVPRPHLEAIGLEPRGRRIYELADGNEIAMDIAVGEIEFMGETVGGTILFGAADAEPLLGVTALESVGIEVDPLNQRLKRLPAVRLKRMSSARSGSRDSALEDPDAGAHGGLQIAEGRWRAAGDPGRAVRSERRAYGQVVQAFRRRSRQRFFQGWGRP